MSKQGIKMLGEDADLCPRLSAAPLDEERAAEPAGVFKALGDPARLRLPPVIA
ncbi:hypothetical protein [Streptomyces sp. NPDC052015]|uniref:hypothetical protein n=1 Tax=Streptomyces sp. NPDC052015 TaxID=3154755 RepID=UPI00344786DD